MITLNVNETLFQLLTSHNLLTTLDGEFIHITHPLKAKFKATVNYTQINDTYSSRLDVTLVTENNETIIECFGDTGVDAETAIKNNFQNFCQSSLHPLLSFLDPVNQSLTDQVTVEYWELNGSRWKAFIGNISTKSNGENTTLIDPITPFFNAVENGIKSCALTGKIHWFRGYYLQHKDKIIVREFLMDNENLSNTDELLADVLIVPGLDYYSLRIFIILQRINDETSADTITNKRLNKGDGKKTRKYFSWLPRF